MTLARHLAAALLVGALPLGSPTLAQGRPEGRPEARPAAPPTGRPGGQPQQRSRPAPPPFKGHPPGVHPHGPMVRPHPVRVLPPRVVDREHHEWGHWAHPEFARPIYYWEWGAVRSVTCVAEDSYGDQYPVTELAVPGFGPQQVTSIEDDALDRCYYESGQDPSCYLVTCSPY